MKLLNWKVIVGVLVLCSGIASGAVNVYLAPGVPASLQADFIANATTYFNGQLVANQYVPGSYNLTITGKKAAPPPPPTQCPSDFDRDLALMVSASTWTYVYGFANGASDERFRDMTTVSNYLVQCSSPSIFNHVTGSTSSWDVFTCQDALGTAVMRINEQNTGEPSFIPVMGH